MTAVKSSGSKELIKAKLKKISSLLHVISYETLIQILKQISIFKYDNLHREFAQLSIMHGQNCRELLAKMDVEEDVKVKLHSHLDEFFDSLVKTTKTVKF